MLNLLNGLAGMLVLVVSIGGVSFLVYNALKNGFRLIPIVGTFLVVCMSAYLLQNPMQIPKIGGILINGITDILMGKAW